MDDIKLNLDEINKNDNSIGNNQDEVICPDCGWTYKNYTIITNPTCSTCEQVLEVFKEIRK